MSSALFEGPLILEAGKNCHCLWYWILLFIDETSINCFSQITVLGVLPFLTLFKQLIQSHISTSFLDYIIHAAYTDNKLDPC